MILYLYFKMCMINIQPFNAISKKKIMKISNMMIQIICFVSMYLNQNINNKILQILIINKLHTIIEGL